jgi:hypothetical protein
VTAVDTVTSGMIVLSSRTYVCPVFAIGTGNNVVMSNFLKMAEDVSSANT